KDVKAGLASARKAQRLETPDLIAQRPFNTVMLRRTHIRLLVLAGRPVEAAPLVESILALGRAHPSPPIDIAVLLAHGSYDMAVGQHDVGLTRLRQALALARHDLTSLSDALITVADAEAQAGNRDAAAVYTAQLADLIHAEAVQEARKQIEISSLYQHIEEEAVSSVIIAFEALQQPVHPQTLKENFEMLSITASFRLDKTGHHGPRVGDLSYLLAAEAGYESPTADLIGYAARFHDIGLLAAPIELFQSPRFSPADIETIRRHARTGADMLTTSKHPVAPMAAEIAHYHHEHWDGNGYPEGIMGNAIPRPARICAIADVFDALMSPRPHRPALGLSDALVKLATLAGNQLDPELTALFIRSAEQGKIRHYLTGLSSSPSLPALDDMLARLPHQ
ncbi:MAG: HD domain-containing protein, partial [Betaproteobacteria bacterium]|nr:HD domain-containing protein [Betaproteobacteria bacterium]